MSINLQPTLSNELFLLRPLQASDFEVLFAAAADPLIWEQHPNPDRYQRSVFETFFEGALASKGAFLAECRVDGEVIGSSRFYNFEETAKSIFIGYTFLARKYWGKGYNAAMKQLMLEHAFGFADKVLFHVGATNFRSQKAMEKLGAQKTCEIEVAYHGETIKTNFEYMLTKG